MYFGITSTVTVHRKVSSGELEMSICYPRNLSDPHIRGIYLQRGRMAQAAEVPFGGTLTSGTAVVTLIPTEQ